jgi:hypothetical protein
MVAIRIARRTSARFTRSVATINHHLHPKRSVSKYIRSFKDALCPISYTLYFLWRAGGSDTNYGGRP